ncbi:MAG: L-fucokinase [Ruminococcus sp.]
MARKRYIVRGYGIKDNPKKTLEERGSFLDGDLQSFINLNNLKTEDIWESEDHSLWKAKLYPVTDSQEKAVSWALLLHRMSSEKADEVKVAEWKSLKRYSLEESFQIADASVLVPWEENLENRILIERFLNRLRAGEHYVDSLKTFGITELDEKQFDMLMEMAEKELPFEEKSVFYTVFPVP